MSVLFNEWEKQQSNFESKLKHLFQLQGLQGELQLVNSINYALFTGGKRFRPMLALASCLSLKKDFTQAIDWALAIEMIHTYSLIHDDLPCMDDDDFRRGMPTVHKKYGEACALLAGDALLTEAFVVLARNPDYKNGLSDLISILGEASGYKGMIGGQANDCLMSEFNADDFLMIHTKKTAALIKAAMLGPFVIFNASPKIKSTIADFAIEMGVLFQIKDDLLDFEQQDNDGLPSVMSLEDTQSLYAKYLKQAYEKLNLMSAEIQTQPFADLLDYNSERKK